MSENTPNPTPAPAPAPIVIEHPVQNKSFWRRHGQKIFWFGLGAIATGLAATYLDDDKDKEEDKEEETTN